MRQVLKHGVIMGVVLFVLQTTAHADTISINPNIPGVDSPTDLVSIVVNFYQFALLTGAILAFGSIVYGAVNYALSESVGTKNDAKDRIVDAFIGLVLLAGAYLLLYTINPALTILTNPGLEKISEITTASLPPGGIAVGGGCHTPNANSYCTPEKLAAAGCNRNGCSLQNLAVILNFESRGCKDPAIPSGTDRCTDGNAWSFGVVQINMLANSQQLCGVSPTSIFSINPQGAANEKPNTELGGCLRRNQRGVCLERNCKVINQTLYNQCVAKITDPTANLQRGCQLYNTDPQGCYHPWETTRKTCGF